MSTKDEAPPVYDSAMAAKEGKSRNTKVMWGLVFYAGAVTAALITVSVFGSMYGWNNVTVKGQGEDKENFKAEDAANIKRYHTKDDKTEDDIEIDVNRDREIIRQIEPDSNVSILVLDFKKNFGGVYNAKFGICMILKDFKNQIPDARNYSYYLDHANLYSGGEEAGDIQFEVNPAEPVDLTTLPPELIEPCWGKPVYGLTQKTDDDHVDREKRAICLTRRYRFCWYARCGWRMCIRCRYYYIRRCFRG